MRGGSAQLMTYKEVKHALELFPDIKEIFF